jgi:small subunit ribosomal protein S20
MPARRGAAAGAAAGPIRAAGVLLVAWSTVSRAARPQARQAIIESRKGSFVANIKSQIKRIKTNEKARQRNKAVKSELKTAIRRTREAVAARDAEKATAAAQEASRKLDKAVSKGVLHKNNAANKKSALAQSLSSLKG